MNPAVTTEAPRPEPTPRVRKTSARVRVGSEDALAAYTTRGFIDDQRFLFRRPEPPGPFDDRVERLDGWYLVLHPETAGLESGKARAMYEERFGPESGPSRLTRFLAISRFLDENRDDIARSGLCAGEDSLAIREEFVQFLIDRYAGRHATIPASALRRFLDEWGHRWI